MVWTANVVYYTEAYFTDPANVLWMVARERARPSPIRAFIQLSLLIAMHQSRRQ